MRYFHRYLFSTESPFFTVRTFCFRLKVEGLDAYSALSKIWKYSHFNTNIKDSPAYFH